MGNLRKLLAGDITHGSLAGSPLHEVPLDRIYALGTTDALGACLWRLKFANDPTTYRRAVALLGARSKGIERLFTSRIVLAKTVIREWLDDNCRKCGGRRMIPATSTSAQAACTLCDGTGLRRYSDQWRMAQVGADPKTYHHRWERKFAAVHQIVADADLNTWRDVARQLGRIPTREEEQKYLEKYTARATLGSVNADDEGQNIPYMPESLVSSAVG